ncbi:hypothetical protein D3C87_1363010 [compost metagenome]
MDAAAHAAHLGAGHVHDLFLRVIHQAHALRHALGHHHPGGQRAVHVENFHPVVVPDAVGTGLGLRDPHVRAAAREREHAQVVRVGGVDAPLLVRGDPVQHQLRVAVGLPAQHRRHRAGVDGRLVDAGALAKVEHPAVVLVELLAPGQRAPGNQLVDIGVAGVVADFLGLQPGPRRRRDDLARLGLYVPEADLVVLAAQRQVGVRAAGDLG